MPNVTDLIRPPAFPPAVTDDTLFWFFRAYPSGRTWSNGSRTVDENILSFRWNQILTKPYLPPFRVFDRFSYSTFTNLWLFQIFGRFESWTIPNLRPFHEFESFKKSTFSQIFGRLKCLAVSNLRPFQNLRPFRIFDHFKYSTFSNLKTCLTV